MGQGEAGGVEAAELKKSGAQSFDGPMFFRFGVEKTIVNAGGAALPELDGFRHHAEAAPEGGQGDFPVFEFFADLVEFLHEQFPRADDRTLLGNPGAEL